LNDEVMKGLMVDGIGVSLGPDFMIIDAIISSPRSEEPVIVTRILLPIRALEGLIETLNKVREMREKAQVKVESGVYKPEV